jgi:hypothetical protein
MGRRLYFPSEGNRAADFMALENPSFSAGFEPANLESNDKHYNHYTAENDYGTINRLILQSLITLWNN